MRKNRKIEILLFLLLLFIFLGATFVLAQKPLEITYPEIPGAKTPLTTKEALPDYIRYIFQLSLFLGALIAFGSFVYGGFRYIASAGKPRIQSDARSQITAGIMGLIILIATYVILNTINPQLVAFKVSLSGAGRRLPAIPIPTAGTATYVKIPLGDLTENLWGSASSPPYRPAECYNFDANGDKIGESPVTQDRLECIKKLSEAIKIKAGKLKEPVAELKELYDCNNCCENCCQNVCSNWAVCADACERGGTGPGWYWENCGSHTCCENSQKEGCWENCGAYACCEGQGMDSYKGYCQASCCGYFQSCSCTSCTGSICRNPQTKEPCSYNDEIVQEKIRQIKGTPGTLGALAQLEIKMGFFPLTEAIKSNQNICCPGDTCPPDQEKGALDCLLSNSDAKTLIKNLLIYQKPDYAQIDENKLKEILKIKEVMAYLIGEGNWREQLLSDRNIAKILLKALGLLENEVAINEIAWMGTKADPTQEWLELYNNTEENIDLASWKLVVKNKFEINFLSGRIPAQGFYLLENNEEVTDIAADLIYSGDLGDQGEILELYDQSGNLVEKVDFHSGWPAGDENTKTSMERINPKEEGSTKNWATNLSFKAVEEQKKDFINGKDKAGNLIYGTPQNPNSVGLEIISYPPLDNLVSEFRRRLENEESFKEKAILVLRKDENLEKMVKTKEALKEILVGEDERLKRLLQEREVLRLLFEDEDNLNSLLQNTYAQEVFRKALQMEEATWNTLKTQLTEARKNSKLINDFRQDLLWVLEARDLMQSCEEDPISIDQFRTPGLFPDVKIEKIPEWEKIESGVTLPGETEPGHDPATFYCHKPLW